MKKLLLILFITLGLVNSANANSIDGAFGYKLGQPMPNTEVTCNVFACGYARENFILENQIPPFDYGYFETTLNEKKIFKIYVEYVVDSTKKNSCFIQESYGNRDLHHFTRLLKLLQARYGATFERDFTRNAKDTYQYIGYGFEDGDRSIQLSCIWEYKRPAFYKPYEGSLTLKLTYYDHRLQARKSKERIKLMKKKALEESSDYDI